MNLKKLTKYIYILLATVIVGIATTKIAMPLNTNVENELNRLIDVYTIIENKANDKILKDFSIISEKKDTLLISSLLSRPKLIYRFSELHCDSCINKEFENLRKCIVTERLGVNDVIIICYYQNPRNLNIFKRINKLQDFKMYNLTNNTIGAFELENLEVPYFFMLNKEFKISNTFIPIKAASQRTDDYLKKVSSIL